jgi:hypothetical protein
MNIFVLGNEVITLFISIGINLIIHFSDPMTAAGGDDNINVTPLNGNKSFILNSTSKKPFETNIVFFNEKDNFNIRLTQNNKYAHDFIELKRGSEDNSFTVKFENEHFRVLEGMSSTLIENKLDEPIIVNDGLVRGRGFTSKGAPIFITAKDQTYLLNHGREL